MAGPQGFEPKPTVLETDMLPITPWAYMEQMIGFEPTPPVWKTGILTSYTTSAYGAIYGA